MVARFFRAPLQALDRSRVRARSLRPRRFSRARALLLKAARSETKADLTLVSRHPAPQIASSSPKDALDEGRLAIGTPTRVAEEAEVRDETRHRSIFRKAPEGGVVSIAEPR